VPSSGTDVNVEAAMTLSAWLWFGRVSVPQEYLREAVVHTTGMKHELLRPHKGVTLVPLYTPRGRTRGLSLFSAPDDVVTGLAVLMLIALYVHVSKRAAVLEHLEVPEWEQSSPLPTSSPPGTSCSSNIHSVIYTPCS